MAGAYNWVILKVQIDAQKCSENGGGDKNCWNAKMGCHTQMVEGVVMLESLCSVPVLACTLKSWANCFPFENLPILVQFSCLCV